MVTHAYILKRTWLYLYSCNLDTKYMEFIKKDKISMFLILWALELQIVKINAYSFIPESDLDCNL